MLGCFVTRRIFLVAAINAVAFMPAIHSYVQQSAVDSESISDEVDIAQRSKLRQFAPGNNPTRDQVIDELRNERRKIHEARKLGVEVSDAEVEEAYAKMAGRMRLTAEQMDQGLARSGVSPETVKQRIRAEIAWRRYQQQRRQDPPPLGRDNG
jgi:peptidyl-prolyl cis-trans isomerase SurA